MTVNGFLGYASTYGSVEAPCEALTPDWRPDNSEPYNHAARVVHVAIYLVKTSRTVWFTTQPPVPQQAQTQPAPPPPQG